MFDNFKLVGRNDTPRNALLQRLPQEFTHACIEFTIKEVKFTLLLMRTEGSVYFSLRLLEEMQNSNSDYDSDFFNSYLNMFAEDYMTVPEDLMKNVPEISSSIAATSNFKYLHGGTFVIKDIELLVDKAIEFVAQNFWAESIVLLPENPRFV